MMIVMIVTSIIIATFVVIITIIITWIHSGVSVRPETGDLWQAT